MIQDRMRLAWLSAREQWRRNPRLRAGGMVIAAVVALYLFLVASDWKEQLAQQYVDRRDYLWRMQSLVGEDEWLQRAEEAAELRSALEAQVPEAATLGLAQASVQTWVRDLMAAYGGGTLQVQAQSAQPIEGRPEWVRVPVTVSGGLEPTQVVDLIRQVERNANLAVIEQAGIMNRQNRTFSLTIVAFYRVAEAGDAGG